MCRSTFLTLIPFLGNGVSWVPYRGGRATFLCSAVPFFYKFIRLASSLFTLQKSFRFFFLTLRIMFESDASEKRYDQSSSDYHDYTAPVDLKFPDMPELSEYDRSLAYGLYIDVRDPSMFFNSFPFSICRSDHAFISSLCRWSTRGHTLTPRYECWDDDAANTGEEST